jgi:hypothetical protein
VVRVVWAAVRVGAVVLAAWGAVLVDKTLVVSAQEPQYGMSHSLPLARPGQPQHRSYRREGCASQAPSSVDRLSSAIVAISFSCKGDASNSPWYL